MSPFLYNVASTLLSTYGTDLSKITVVFPNKRASLFLNEHLASLSDQPLWSPSYTTISDLFRNLSRRQVADQIKLICDLYHSFTKCTGIEETLDHFYGWGEILLADFDDLDKQLAPAEKVFANLRDIHEYDDDSYLTEQQREVIRRFFSNFSEGHNSELKQRFLSLWSHLYDIYVDFNERLSNQGLAYEGALYREVTESGELDMPQDHYVFVGFNLLHPVEQALIDKIGRKATLIQDDDEEVPKEVTFVSAPTDNIQARYVSTWLSENHRIEAGSRTAIVLADESMLQGVIHCLPEEVAKVNVTTGYPLSQTTIATDIIQREKKTHEDSSTDCAAWLNKLISSVGDSARQQTDPLQIESHFRMYTLLNRLLTLVESGDLQVQLPTIQRLLSQIVSATTIPFHGEPIEGIQIMGVLETRNLDFDHILLLSCNEGNLPKGVNDTSFIPYSIRKAYGLTTIDHKVAIYQNYFRRMLQRATDVTLVYNNSTNDGKTGEMSQFMLQMLVESKHHISSKTLQAGQKPILKRPKPVVKTTEVMEALQRRFPKGKFLSPSALSKYLRCQLQFFYHYAAQIEELEDENDTIDNRIFGNIFHKASQNIYQRMMTRGKSITMSDIDEQLKHDVDIIRAVDDAFKLEFFHIEDPAAKLPPLDGLQLINREVIIKYVHQLLEIDRKLTPFRIIGLEKKVSMDVEVKGMGVMTLGGYIDRIDEIALTDGSKRIRIVDYKTGSGRIKPMADVSAIFVPENIKNHSDYYLQTFLYAIAMNKTDTEVSPCLLFIQHAGGDNYDPTLKIGKNPVYSITEVQESFMSQLQTLLNDIFNPSLDFTPTEERIRCKNCPYASICEQ